MSDVIHWLQNKNLHKFIILFQSKFTYEGHPIKNETFAIAQ